MCADAGSSSRALYSLRASSMASSWSGECDMTPFALCESASGLICFSGRSVVGEVGGCLRLVVPFCSIGGGVFIDALVCRERLPRASALELASLVEGRV
jgi:hypothetical protein